ncbi:MAG: tRNA (adenosine(37)-N6)-threonylcarbamoyltransferase complex ATPase subunit type 1 TsaE [Patescibacteria group bacterium]|nr:tRNA (adenosine(37)-N6)-threonylcarbamoyltransferase complex ATPase subunit type 1 TsaE [Patescibacteria group bacterium]
MPKNQITTKSSEETKEFAKILVSEWLKINKTKNSNWLVCLYGDLGAGKTTFVRGLAEKFGVKQAVNSPTFLIIKKYNSSKKENRKYTLYHFDCYRISKSEDILDLGWEDIINGENNIIVIEWPEKIEKILPKKKLNIKFEFVNEDTRKIKFKNNIYLKL